MDVSRMGVLGLIDDGAYIAAPVHVPDSRSPDLRVLRAWRKLAGYSDAQRVRIMRRVHSAIFGADMAALHRQFFRSIA